MCLRVVDSAQTGQVARAQWSVFLRWFGPLAPAQEERAFFKMEQMLGEYRHTIRQRFATYRQGGGVAVDLH